jgi:pyridoxine kinase
MAGMNILSVQSHVAYGHVGNAAASFPLQRLGFEVWPVNTVQFSNHTGYPSWRGRVFPPDHVAEVIDGLFETTPPASCAAVLSGYLGEAALGQAVLAAVTRVRAANPAMLYLCDPVMGDAGRGLYVRSDIPDFLRAQALPAADIVTPNQFELELLAGGEVRSLADARAAAEALRAAGPEVVLVTSLRHAASAPDTVEMLVVDGTGAWRLVTPWLAMQPLPDGAGDLAAALFLAHYLKRRDAAASLAETAAAVFAVLLATQAAGSRELQVVAAQHELVAPSRRFAVTALP